MTSDVQHHAPETTSGSTGRVVRLSGPWFWLSSTAALLAAAGSALGLSAADRIYGQETAALADDAAAQDIIVNLLLVVPLMVALGVRARRGSLRAYLGWSGCVAFTVYNSHRSWGASEQEVREPRVGHVALEPVHFVMGRKLLRTIERRATSMRRPGPGAARSWTAPARWWASSPPATSYWRAGRVEASSTAMPEVHARMAAQSRKSP